ncbi:hypothetical protein [Bosea sp. LjRoot237]|uniref:hypothetical protein n=1 Tax=Bosea sp. LjRoot237 TaxID=3342292 RepID=UPI003ED17420
MSDNETKIRPVRLAAPPPKEVIRTIRIVASGLSVRVGPHYRFLEPSAEDSVTRLKTAMRELEHFKAKHRLLLDPQNINLLDDVLENLRWRIAEHLNKR